jgi:hypothetical protein
MVWWIGRWSQARVCERLPVDDTGRNLTTQECKYRSVSKVTREYQFLRITWIKRIRVYGGCLGVRCRRRTWYTAKSSGEPCAGVRTGNVRMGKPGVDHTASSRKGREPRELKHLSSARKRDHSVSSGERTRNSLNRSRDRGCRVLI